MYYEHFGLREPPFRITPDTRLFFPGGSRGAILDAIVYAIASGEGIIKVIGEVADWQRQSAEETAAWRKRLAAGQGKIIN